MNKNWKKIDPAVILKAAVKLIDYKISIFGKEFIIGKYDQHKYMSMYTDMCKDLLDFYTDKKINLRLYEELKTDIYLFLRRFFNKYGIVGSTFLFCCQNKYVLEKNKELLSIEEFSRHLIKLLGLTIDLTVTKKLYYDKMEKLFSKYPHCDFKFEIAYYLPLMFYYGNGHFNLYGHYISANSELVDSTIDKIEYLINYR